MSVKETRLLLDSPVDEDAFGTHDRIAAELADLVAADESSLPDLPHSIAVLGDWGSGKSSVIRMLRRRISGPQARAIARESHLFVYDAWSHEGDGLRRAFLEALHADLRNALSDEENAMARAAIWDKHEHVTTTTEPLLRPYGRILLFSLFISPIGIALFGRYPDSLDPLYEQVWNSIVLSALVLPIVLLSYFAIAKRYFKFERIKQLFDVRSEDELEKLQILSVFVNKSQGQVDYRQITNPDDSISQFIKAFRMLCGFGLARHARIAIVIDNIDRLTKEEARSFWSTMQSFIDRSGWRNDEVMRRVWLIVPFSERAVEHFFSDDEGAKAIAARSFIQKSFDLSFYVPTPIQVDSRGYLLRQLSTAFPSELPASLEAVRNLFDSFRATTEDPGMAGTAAASRRTPREMKLFVNQLVALYRTRGEELPVETLAAYLLTRDDISEKGIKPDEQLSPYQRSLLPRVPDAIQQLAAVHFGVSLASAAQVILAGPIRSALQEEDSLPLDNLAGSSGFVDVLESLIVSDVGVTLGHVLSRAATLAGMKAQDRPPMQSVWQLIVRECSNVSQIGLVDVNYAKSVNAIYAGIYAQKRDEFVQIIIDGLEEKWAPFSVNRSQVTGETVEAFEGRVSQGASWARVAEQFVTATNYVGRISVPRGAVFTLRVLDQASVLAGIEPEHLEVRADPSEFAAALATWPGVGIGPEDPIRFVRFVTRHDKLEIPWESLVTPLMAKLTTPDSPSAFSKAAEMCLAIATYTADESLGSRMAEAIESGALESGLAQVDTDETKTLALALAIVIAPQETPGPQTARGRLTPSQLAEILEDGDASVDPDQVPALAKLFIRLQNGTVVLVAIAYNSSLHRIGTRIVSTLVEYGYGFAPSNSELSAVFAFLQNNMPFDEVEKIVGTFTNKKELIAKLGESKIDDSSILVGVVLLSSEEGRGARKLRNRVVEYFRGQDTDKWAEALTSESEYSVMALGSRVRKLGYSVPVGPNLTDAIVRVLSEIGDGHHNPALLGAAISAAENLLSESIKPNLAARIWALLNQTSDPDRIRRIVEASGTILLDVDGVDGVAALNGVFTALASSPDAWAGGWIKSVITANHGWLKPSSAADEFRARLNALLRPGSGYDDETKRALSSVHRRLPKSQRVRSN